MWATTRALLLGVFAIAAGANKTRTKAEINGRLGQAFEGGDKAASMCMALATTPKEKTACRFGSEVKDQIAASSGKNLTEIDDAYVSNLLKRNSQKRIANEMKNCSGKADCWDQARRAAADALGVEKKDIDDFTLKKNMGDAGSWEFKEMMENCSVDAQNDSAKLALCKKTAMESLTKFFDDESPKKHDIKRVMEGATRRATMEAREACEARNMTEEECDMKIKEAIASQSGKRADEMTTLDVKTAIEKAARGKAVEAAEACLTAKSDKADASCPEFYDEYVKMKGGQKKTGIAEKIEKDRVTKKLVADSAAANKRVCFSEKNKANMSKCLARVKLENDNLTELVFKDKSQRISSKKSAADREASISALGSLYEDCIDESTNASEKLECEADFEMAKSATGIKWNSKSVLKSHRGKQVADAAASCKASEGKSCRKELKEKLVKGGMESREFRGVKLLGAIKTAAETWASCTEASGNETVCIEEAKKDYLFITGCEDEGFTRAVKMKVRKLAQALIDGVETEVRPVPAVDIGVTTDEPTCSNTTRDNLKKKLKDAAGQASSGFGNISEPDYFVVDAACEYSVNIFVAANMTDDSIDAEAKGMGERLDSVDLSRRLRSDVLRRLAKTTEVFAAQSQEECSVNDQQCGTNSDATSATGTTQVAGVTSNGTASTTVGTTQVAGVTSNGTTVGTTQVAGVTSNATNSTTSVEQKTDSARQSGSISAAIATVCFFVMSTKNI